MSIQFRYGIPLPAENAAGYDDVFIVEQWMRRSRLALAAISGTNLNSALNDELVAELKKRRAVVAADALLRNPHSR